MPGCPGHLGTLGSRQLLPDASPGGGLLPPEGTEASRQPLALDLRLQLGHLVGHGGCQLPLAAVLLAPNLFLWTDGQPLHRTPTPRHSPVASSLPSEGARGVPGPPPMPQHPQTAHPPARARDTKGPGVCSQGDGQRDNTSLPGPWSWGGRRRPRLSGGTGCWRREGGCPLHQGCTWPRAAHLSRGPQLGAGAGQGWPTGQGRSRAGVPDTRDPEPRAEGARVPQCSPQRLAVGPHRRRAPVGSASSWARHLHAAQHIAGSGWTSPPWGHGGTGGHGAGAGTPWHPGLVLTMVPAGALLPSWTKLWPWAGLLRAPHGFWAAWGPSQC